ncbi:L-seryl-tRNA(Sec) selenium transferase [Sulfitobacter sp. HNIBRBA3233]|uniref:L-seryl-tRNA(Sec) selenium transferase n=1 Tax=Sulfitobacter marinivivus TaxID=3158558 RepID=UPI0032DEE92F
MNVTLRDLPQIQSLIQAKTLAALVERYSHAEVTDALRTQIQGLRDALLAGEQPDLPDFTSGAFAATIEATIVARRTPPSSGVVNATGILIHTNLGRARLAPEALHAAAEAGEGAQALEFDLETGKRGARGAAAEQLVCQLTGAEAALVVNNCAAAVLLALTALARGRSVIASRGELIEIGGSYRLPDVIAQSGAQLREVGATNRTRLSDYVQAVDAETAVLLKSHASNFRIVGFTGAPTRSELATLARERDLVLMEDLGSGILIDLAAQGLGDEPVVADILRSGVDLVMFSGDKLLGGPQAGIIAGRADLVARLRAHPMFRALRSDKMTLAALAATLRLYLPPHDPLRDVPVLAMLATPVAELRTRAEAIVAQVEGPVELEITDSAAQVGAGAMPERDLQSVAIALRREGQSADALAAALRGAQTPVIGRIHAGRVLLDMRSTAPSDTPAIVSALRALCP